MLELQRIIRMVVMRKIKQPGSRQKNRSHAAGSHGRIIHRQGNLLLCIFPFSRLLFTASQVDPVVEIGLPQDEPRLDTSVISAYYLSFCE